MGTPLRDRRTSPTIQTEILKTVRQFVDKEIIPVATELEHADEYPHGDRRRA